MKSEEPPPDVVVFHPTLTRPNGNMDARVTRRCLLWRGGKAGEVDRSQIGARRGGRRLESVPREMVQLVT